MGKSWTPKEKKRRVLTVSRIYEALSAKGMSEQDSHLKVAALTGASLVSVKNWRSGRAVPGDSYFSKLVQVIQNLVDEAVQHGDSQTAKSGSFRKAVRKRKVSSSKSQSSGNRKDEAKSTVRRATATRKTISKGLEFRKNSVAETPSESAITMIEASIRILDMDGVMHIAEAVLRRIIALRKES